MKYVFKKALLTVLTLVILSFLVFLAFSVIPGDPALAQLGTEATPEKLQALREEMGLNGPFFLRYINWAGSFLSGNLGTSYTYHVSVGSLLWDKLPITITLAFLSICMIVFVSIPLGIYSARRAGRTIDRVIMVSNHIIMAIPQFFAGIIISFVAGYLLHLFVPGKFISYEDGFFSFLQYMIAPSIAIALPKCAMSAKLLRSSLLEEMNKDYIRTAYSRGNSTKAVLYHHALKNALIPNITFWAMTFTDIFAGSVVIEQVFGIPGIGNILLVSIANRDYPVVQAIILLLAFIIIMVNLFVDIIYRIVDPRVGD